MISYHMKTRNGDIARGPQEAGDLFPQNRIHRQRYPSTPIQAGTLLSRTYLWTNPAKTYQEEPSHLVQTQFTLLIE